MKNHVGELICELFIRIINGWPGSAGVPHTRAPGAVGSSWAWRIFQRALCFPADVSLGYLLPINTDKNTEPLLEKGGGFCESCWEMAPGAISGHELGDRAAQFRNGAICFQEYFSYGMSSLSSGCCQHAEETYMSSSLNFRALPLPKP